MGVGLKSPPCLGPLLPYPTTPLQKGLSLRVGEGGGGRGVVALGNLPPLRPLLPLLWQQRLLMPPLALVLVVVPVVVATLGKEQPLVQLERVLRGGESPHSLHLQSLPWQCPMPSLPPNSPERCTGGETLPSERVWTHWWEGSGG